MLVIAFAIGAESIKFSGGSSSRETTSGGRPDFEFLCGGGLRTARGGWRAATLKG